jgi:uncharacterized FlaG/YvyC family protein
MYKLVVAEIKPDKTTEVIREPQYKKLEVAITVADKIFMLLGKELEVKIIDLDTNRIVYMPNKIK